jgi:hypothetical protein
MTITREMRRERLAWAAGLFDGEGCFITYHRTAAGCPIPALSVAQADDAVGVADVLTRFGEALGLPYRVYTMAQAKPHHRPKRNLRITGFVRAQQALAMLWPWLGEVKRQQAKRVLRGYVDYWRGPGVLANFKRHTHCPAGHAYDEANTYLDKTNRRHCRACERVRSLARYRRLTAAGQYKRGTQDVREKQEGE